jgi:hypothetical protein
VVKTELLLTEENARFVAEHEDAMAIVNEMMTQFLAGLKEAPERLKFENRPDWQAKYQRSQDDLANGRVIPDEDVADWKNLSD